jgi:hypothetical protein
MKKKTEYWVEPVEHQEVGVWDGRNWYGTYGWSTARFKTIRDVRKMINCYPNLHFIVRRVVYQKGDLWYYPRYTLKKCGCKIKKLPELW